MIRLIVLDLDGTIAPIEKPVADSTLKLLKEFEAQGIDIAISSGKPIYYLCGLCRQLDFENPILIGENGAIIQGGIHAPSDLFLVNYYSDDARESIRIFKEKLLSKVDHIFFQPNDIGLAFFANSDIRAVVDEIEATTELKDVVIYRHTDGFDVTPVTINKGTGLKMLMDAKGYKSDEIIAVGDGSNDVAMFKLVDTSIRLRNKEDATYSFETIDEALIFIKENLI